MSRRTYRMHEGEVLVGLDPAAYTSIVAARHCQIAESDLTAIDLEVPAGADLYLSQCRMELVADEVPSAFVALDNMRLTTGDRIVVSGRVTLSSSL